MAARVHDSVLQTLALIQRHAHDPRRVASLARRQERQLRGWLYADQPLGDETASLVAALRRPRATSRSSTAYGSSSRAPATVPSTPRSARWCSRRARR